MLRFLFGIAAGTALAFFVADGNPLVAGILSVIFGFGFAALILYLTEGV